MACKLYVSNGECCCELGTFRNRQKAEEFWKAVRYPMADKLGHVKPVYVETRKVRKKMIIPNTCKCLWCDGTMERKGVTQMGFGMNTFSLWCDKCGAVTIHIRHTNKKIKKIDSNIEYEEK